MRPYVLLLVFALSIPTVGASARAQDPGAAPGDASAEAAIGAASDEAAPGAAGAVSAEAAADLGADPGYTLSAATGSAVSATDPAASSGAADAAAPPAAPALEQVRSRGDEDVEIRGASRTTVFAAGSNVDYDADAPDVLAAGDTVRLRGTVRDNLLAAGRSVTAGPVGGDAFLVGETLILARDVQGDVYAMGSLLTIPADVQVGGNLYFAGATLALHGAVLGSVRAAGADFDLRGRVGGDVELEAARVSVGPEAQIGGRLAYRSAQAADIPAGAAVGEVVWTEKTPEIEAGHHDGGGAWFRVFALLAAALLASTLLFAAPRALRTPSEVLVAEAPTALGVGFAVLLGVPVVALFLALFVLPIPLSLFAMAVYVPATFLARFVAALALGGLIWQRLGRDAQPWAALLAGLLVLHIGYAIPLLGGLVMLGATVLGLGALFLSARRAVA